MDSFAEQQLTGGGDTLLHYHLADRATNAGLQSDARVVSPPSGATTYAIPTDADFVLVDLTASNVTVTLPLARNGREIEVVYNAGAKVLTILPTTGDTIMGEPNAVVTVVGTALRFKAVSSNWIVI